MAWNNGASLKQTSYNVAGNVVAAAVGAKALEYDNALAELNRVAEAVFTELSKDSDGGGGGERRSRRGSRKSARGSGSKKVTLRDARDTVFKFGAFEGLTMGDVMEMSLNEAEDYGYDKPGRAYITWVSKQERNPFMAKRAALLIEAAREQSDDDEEEFGVQTLDDDEPLDDEDEE